MQQSEEQALQSAETFAEARHTYLTRAEEALGFLRSQGVAGTAKHAAAAMMTCLDEAQLDSEAEALLQRVGDAWAALAALPPGGLPSR